MTSMIKAIVLFVMNIKIQTLILEMPRDKYFFTEVFATFGLNFK